MLFNFNRFNHGRQGRIIVEDITRIMAAQIEALGHETRDVEEGPFIGKPLGYNVVLEAFDDPKHAQAIIDASVDCNFIIVATEEPSDDGFNHGLDPAMLVRQNAFPAVAKRASGILHLVPGTGVTSWYAQFAPAAAAELGYARSLVDLRGVAPEFDFGFYGKMTWRRRQMLERLGQRTASKVHLIDTLDVPWRKRDEEMRRCRVIVQILGEELGGEAIGMVSSTRCASALYFGRPVIGEPHPDPWPWGDVVHFSKTVEQFYDDAVNATLSWEAIHDQQIGRFSAKLTPEFCIGAPLRHIGIL